jgi:hypothetical protein
MNKQVINKHSSLVSTLASLNSSYHILSLPYELTNTDIVTARLKRFLHTIYSLNYAKVLGDKFKNIVNNIYIISITSFKQNGIYPCKRGSNKFAFFKVRKTLVELHGQPSKGELL